MDSVTSHIYIVFGEGFVILKLCSMSMKHFPFVVFWFLADAVRFVPVQEKADITNYQPVLTPPEH